MINFICAKVTKKIWNIHDTPKLLTDERRQAMNKTNQWISVDEALPELYERVLVIHRLANKKSVCIMKRIPHDHLNPDNPKWYWSLTNNKEDVFAWMPLPEFKEGGEQ